jgi:UrcA family protein
VTRATAARPDTSHDPDIAMTRPTEPKEPAMYAHLKSLAFAAALSTLAGAAAHAQTVEGFAISVDRMTQSQSVSYADLDLTSAAGMKTLTTRINSAAKTVCGPAPEYRESRTPYETCVKSAADHAMIQVARAAEASRLAMSSQRRHGG